VVAYGGRGGRGNKRFATSRNQAPRFAQPGESGQTLVLVLELKLLAEVGIIGLPNAGKSTLISRISSARPKVGDYPFTTLTPNIGMVQAQWGEPFAVADIPGLVEGAHSGTGLGIKFLRHIERTRILLHLIDASAIDPEKPLEAYTTINHELARYSETLARKTQIVVLNKVDIPGVREKVQIIQDAIPDQNILVISAVTGEGVETLTSQLAAAIEEKA
jgi:GTP-binding protein